MSQTTTLVNGLATASKMTGKDDEVYTINELIKRRAEELQHAPLLGYPKEGLIDYEEYSALAVDKYVDAAAQALQDRGILKVNSDQEKAPVVGILAHSGLHIIITLLGLSRLGYAVLLLSTRLPSNAISRLLDLSDCDIVLTTSNFHSVLAEVQAERKLSLVELLVHSDYYGVDALELRRSYEPKKETLKNAVIIHSSGSTGLPKPIFLTHRNCIGAFATNLDMRALITSPLFHSQGFYETFRSIYSGKPIYYCNYNLPLTKQNLTAMIDYVKPDLLHCVPYVLKLLAESDEGVNSLKKVKFILFAGSACPDDLGDRLVRNGVNINGNYGATETGRLMTSARPAGDHDWNYLRFLPQVRKYVLMDEIAPGIYECVALDGLRSKSTTNSNDPPGSFRTRDLFIPHPTKPDIWKYVSRLDDRFTLVNGEKVLPIPIEGRIRQETLVQEAVVFGDGKSVPGVLIVKSEMASDIPDDEYLEQIWPAVQDANTRAESFSHVPKDLVVILPSSTTYPKTDKGTFIRAQMYAQFKEQIEDAYSRFESYEGGTIALPPPELERFLLKRFKDYLGVELESTEADFFASGIDSLQCMTMWSLLKRELDLGGRESQLGQNVLYESGNIQHLARHLDGLRTGNLDNLKNEHQVMNDLISKYAFAPFNRKPATIPSEEVVLLTGVTGGLGAHLLSQLVQKSNVAAVWAFIRADSDESAMQRVLKSLAARDVHLSPEQQRKIVALASDLGKLNFGLDDTRFKQLRSSLTLVIHSAWAVNFNISVQSFEAQHISAVHRLIDFCQSTTHDSPARFYFCSSVSSAGGTPRPGTVSEGPVPDIEHAQGTGYARSKYVTEFIVRNAMKDAGAHARNLRIGQLVGDSRVGEWNTTEGIPLMIQTAITLGALPALDEEMTWLPMDYAADIILDLTGVNQSSGSGNLPDDPDLVYHVLNPKRFHWTRDMLPALAAAGLKFETLPTDKWMERLRESDKNPKNNPPIKLLDWFESKYGNAASKAPKGPLDYETKETSRFSETIGRVPDVTDGSYVGMVVDRLRQRWEAEAKR